MAKLVQALAHSAALIFALPAGAETQHMWAGGYSSIAIQPTDAPGAVAEIVFDNRTVHSDTLERFDLTLDGLTVTVEALVGRGLTPDRMSVTVPDGYIAVPPDLDVAEDEVGVILVLPFLGF
jgi:hypothetical protein